jgi:hypothetical protein
MIRAVYCRHCKQLRGARVGRGLCRTCWEDKTIRERYPPLAAFGGKGASECWAEQKRVGRGQ